MARTTINTVKNVKTLSSYSRARLNIKDFWSAVTHGIAMIIAFAAAFPLGIHAKRLYGPGSTEAVATMIFIISMILLYGASTAYHTFDVNDRVNHSLKVLDHTMIYVLIAGSYTPVCLIVLPPKIGLTLLALVWGLSFAGIVFKIAWVTCPKWLGSSIYILLGWSCLLAFVPIYKNMSTFSFTMLVIGGVIYTIGGVVYALKKPEFDKRHPNFGMHEIFHLFVMGGSLFHYITMYSIL